MASCSSSSEVEEEDGMRGDGFFEALKEGVVKGDSEGELVYEGTGDSDPVVSIKNDNLFFFGNVVVSIVKDILGDFDGDLLAEEESFDTLSFDFVDFDKDVTKVGFEEGRSLAAGEEGSLRFLELTNGGGSDDVGSTVIFISGLLVESFFRQ